MKQLKIFKISQNVNTEYDTFSDAIVIVESEEDAKRIHPYLKSFKDIFYDDKVYTTSRDLEVNFKNINNFSEVVIRVKSDKEDSKFALDIYNYNNESWETYYDGYLGESYLFIDISVFDSERYIEDSEVKLKFDLNESDKYDFDWIELVKRSKK